MKYNYDTKLECFVREDGLGKRIWINSTEAHRIITMNNLGNSIGEIRNKIQFKNARKVTESTIKNFIMNVENGNIILDDNLPAPSDLINELSLDERIRRLEEKLDEFEKRFMSSQYESKNTGTLAEKVKAWIKS